MNSLILKKKTYIILFSIILLGFVLRVHNFTVWPRTGATFDEYAWTWLGLSIINDQIPQSWSPLPAYEDKKLVRYQGAYFVLVKPYLEHPPLFGIIAGTFAKFNGVDSFFEVNVEKIRPLAIILGISSIIILFFLVKELYDEKTALLSSLIYATVPTVVIGSRILQNENFFIPCFLLSLFLIVKYFKKKKPRYRNLAAVVCGFLILAKIPWVAATLSILAILMYLRKYDDIWKFLVIVIPISMLFIIYGLYFNAEIFIDLWQFQLQRYDLSFNSVYALFTEPFLIDRLYIDGWIIFGWISFFILLTKDFKKNYVLALGLLAYLGVFIFAIPNEAGHGWYRYPFYPFLAISLAIFIKEYFNKNIILTFLFLLLIGLSLLENSFKIQFGFSFAAFRVYLIITLISLLPLFFKSKKLAKLSFKFNEVLLIGLFALSFWSILEYNEQ